MVCDYVTIINRVASQDLEHDNLPTAAMAPDV